MHGRGGRQASGWSPVPFTAVVYSDEFLPFVALYPRLGHALGVGGVWVWKGVAGNLRTAPLRRHRRVVLLLTRVVSDERSDGAIVYLVGEDSKYILATKRKNTRQPPAVITLGHFTQDSAQDRAVDKRVFF